MQVYTGQDIIKHNDRVLTDFADGDCAIVTFPNDLHGMRNGKNGNSMGAHNEQGNIAEVQYRIIRGSPDDKYLNSELIAWKNHSDDFAPASGEYTKVLHVDGGVTNDVTSINFMLPTRNVEYRTNTDGETEQEVAVYTYRGGVSSRALA